MNKLEENRQIINEADAEIIAAFKKRMTAIKEIALYKKENGLPIFDSKRELELLEKNIKLLNNEELEQYYKEVLEALLKASKEYQKDLIK